MPRNSIHSNDYNHTIAPETVIIGDRQTNNVITNAINNEENAAADRDSGSEKGEFMDQDDTNDTINRRAVALYIANPNTN